MSDQGDTVRELVNFLLQLQNHDRALQSLQEELRQGPLRIKQARDTLATMRSRLEKERFALHESEAFLKQQQDSIQTLTQQLARSKARSGQVRNTKEATAVQRELENTRRALDLRQQEASQLSAAVANEREKIERFSAQLDQDAAALQTQEDALQQTVQHTRTQAEALEHTRQEILGKIEPILAQRYEAVRRKRWPVLVPAQQATCTGCNMMISPQSFVDLQSGKSLESCSHCQRLLYIAPPATP